MNKLILIGTTLITAVLIGLSFYSFQLLKQNKTLTEQYEAIKKDPQILAKEETKELVAKLSKLVVLPENEEPILATITDKEKLTDQVVFAKTENGDKIIVYSGVKKAYIYRPSQNILVDVISINTNENLTVEKPKSTPTPTEK